MKVAYARVSTRDQNLDMQLAALKEAGCERTYTEKASGVARREQLEQCLQFLREGDTLVVYKLDRLGRSMRDLLAIVDSLQQRNIGLVSLRDNIDATSTAGRLVFHVFAALAEFERSLIAERTSEGRKAARAKGTKFGRPRKEFNDKADACVQLYKGGMTIPQIMQQLSIKSKSTVYRFLRMRGLDPSRKPRFSTGSGEKTVNKTQNS